MGGVKWNGDQWRRDFAREYRKNVSAAAIYLNNQIKADISQPGTAEFEQKTKKGKARKKRIYNFTHSRPGNPPFKQKGRLRASMAWEIVGSALAPIGRVGTNYKVGKYLELGTRKMAARPFLRRNLKLHQSQLAAIVTKKIAAGGLPPIRSNQFRSAILGRGAKRFGF